MTKHLKCLRYLLIHKWYVFIECCKLGIPWRGIKHDWTKFLPSEWNAYASYFYGNGSREAFDVAWNHHQKRNSHHWQYWLLTPDKPRPNFQVRDAEQGLLDEHPYIVDITGQYNSMTVELKPHNQRTVHNIVQFRNALRADLINTPTPLNMPLNDRKEMLADWRGAGKARGEPDTVKWYMLNRNNMILHPDTRAWIEERL